MGGAAGGSCGEFADVFLNIEFFDLLGVKEELVDFADVDGVRFKFEPADEIGDIFRPLAPCWSSCCSRCSWCSRLSDFRLNTFDKSAMIYCNMLKEDLCLDMNIIICEEV